MIQEDYAGCKAQNGQITTLIWWERDISELYSFVQSEIYYKMSKHKKSLLVHRNECDNLII